MHLSQEQIFLAPHDYLPRGLRASSVDRRPARRASPTIPDRHILRITAAREAPDIRKVQAYRLSPKETDRSSVARPIPQKLPTNCNAAGLIGFRPGRINQGCAP